MKRLGRIIPIFFLLLFLFAAPAAAQATTRALLVACSDFSSQPDLGAAISGNLHMIGAALISSDVMPGDLSIEDGTIGTPEALCTAITDAFSDADEDDLSILYLCTHGVLSSSDDEQVYLLLGDGQTESPLHAQQLCDLIRDIQGEKLLILDACYSGALIGHERPESLRLPGSHPEGGAPVQSPFLADSSIHVLTSASGYESSWYYDSDHLSTGAVSYFASALASGLGLYGAPEADMTGDGQITLGELHRYLRAAVPSSSSQLLSSGADMLALPVAGSAMLSRPLCGFSYGASLLPADDPTLEFSFTVTKNDAAVQYRLVSFREGEWDWENAQTFLDAGDSEAALLSAGRKTRTLTLSEIGPQDYGYLMLQVFSMSGSQLTLCSERLIAVQPSQTEETLTLLGPDALPSPGSSELPIDIRLSVPAELTVTVYGRDGKLVNRLASGQMTRPSSTDITRLYWNGRDASGRIVPDGQYTITAETRIGGVRQKQTIQVSVGGPARKSGENDQPDRAH